MLAVVEMMMTMEPKSLELVKYLLLCAKYVDRFVLMLKVQTNYKIHESLFLYSQFYYLESLAVECLKRKKYHMSHLYYYLLQ